MSDKLKFLSTEFYDGQGLGNQLWVYASVRSIAAENGANFILLGIDKFKGNHFLDIDHLVGVNTYKGLLDCNHFHEARFFDPDIECVVSCFDKKVLDIKQSVNLEGLFQSEEYFFGDISKLKKYIRIKKEYFNKVTIPSDACILNVRGGEYKRHKDLILPISYWHSAIKNMKEQKSVTNFLIVTDDVRYANSILPQYEVLRGGVAECYVALNKAKYLVLSNSSFSYFPVKTNENDPFVIAPKHWARFGNEYNKWASPANLYKGWFWQDKFGHLHTYEHCKNEVDYMENFYNDDFFIRVPNTFIQKKILRGFIPLSIRKKVKKILAYFFPRNVG